MQAGDLPEIQIERQQHAVFRCGLAEYVDVRETLQSLVQQVDGVVPLVAEPDDDATRYSNVREKSHTESLCGDDFFLGEPGRVLQRLPDIFRLERRILLE